MADPSVILFTVLVPGPEYGPVVPYADAAADRYLDLLVSDPDRRSYAIEVDGVHIGNVGLKGYDWEKRTAECFIEIGEAAMRGKGVGSAAMRALLDIAFDKMHLELGFVDDGVYGSHWVDGRFWAVDAMLMEARHWSRRQ